MNTQHHMKTFTIIWVGQLLSLVGTAMTRFALLVWAYEQTQTATSVALIGFAAVLPLVVISPVAGVVVDRFDRRLVMIFTDLGAGVTTIALLALHLAGSLQVWHVYLLLGAGGFFEAFQSPAYSAASTLLIPKAYLSRANGMRSLAEMSSQLLAPFAAAALLPLVGLGGVMVVDVLTFCIAVGTLNAVTVPAPPPDTTHANFRARMSVGFAFIFARGGLMGLLVVMMGMNLADGLTYSSVLPVMVLMRTGGDEVALAWVQVALGMGGVLGSIIVSTFGTPRRLIHGVLLCAALSFFFGDGQIGLGDSVYRWSIGAFTASIFIPMVVAAQLTIWQQKTPPAIQGRVFAVKNMLQMATRPLGFLLAGPLADGVFEPAMSEGGTLVGVFGGLVGTGPGAGVALMFLGTAVLGCAFSLGGYLFPAVRRVENDLPDYDRAIDPVPAPM